MPETFCPAHAARTFLLQTPSTHETRSVRMAAMLLDGYQVLNTEFSQLSAHAESLSSGRAMPVGSVEFVRQALRLAGVKEPESNPYPESLSPWFKRKIEKRKAGQILRLSFVKPVHTKLFNGFLFDPLGDPDRLNEHDQEQYAAFMKLDPDAEVWLAEPVRFVSEWRYYVDKNGVIGSARYDDGDDDAPAPNPDDVMVAAEVASQSMRHGFALDMGVLDDGQTALVEVNDAWATGLYANSISPVAYAFWLLQRWTKMVDR